MKNIKENKKILNENKEKIIISNLKDKYFKIKECLSRCGNLVVDCNSKVEVEKIISSFLNNIN